MNSVPAMLSALKLDIQKNIQESQNQTKDQLAFMFRSIIDVVTKGFVARDDAIDEMRAEMAEVKAMVVSLDESSRDKFNSLESVVANTYVHKDSFSSTVVEVRDGMADVASKVAVVERKLLSEIEGSESRQLSAVKIVSESVVAVESSVSTVSERVDALDKTLVDINVALAEVRDSQKMELEMGLSSLSEELKNVPPALNELIENDDIRALMSELKDACATRPKRQTNKADSEVVTKVASSMRVDAVTLKPDVPLDVPKPVPVPRVRESVSQLMSSPAVPVVESRDEVDSVCDDYDGSGVVMDSLSYSEDEMPDEDVLQAARKKMEQERLKMQADAVVARHGNLSTNVLALRAEYEDTNGALRIPMRGFGEKVAGYKAKVAAMKEEYESKFAAWVSEHGKKDASSEN